MITVITAVRPGSVVLVRVAPAGRPYLRFLFGPQDSLNAGTRYTMSSGEAGVTFAVCPPGAGLYADYYGGVLVRDQRCVPVDVWLPGAARPIKVRLGACAGWGPRSPPSAPSRHQSLGDTVSSPASFAAAISRSS